MEPKLLDLLAIIHRDGGHYTDAVGLERSVHGAHKILGQLMAAQDELETLRAQLTQACLDRAETGRKWSEDVNSSAHLRRENETLRKQNAALREDLEKARQERDLAIAHDRQPYPTAHAYEKACEALNSAKQREAAMREAAKLGVFECYCAFEPAAICPKCTMEAALQPDAGARYLSPEQVKPLVEALEMWCPPEFCSCGIGHESGVCSCADCHQHYVRREALAYAKTLSL